MIIKNQYLKYKKNIFKLKIKIFGGIIIILLLIHYKFSDPKFSKVLPDLNNTFLTYFVRDYSRHRR